MQSITPTSSRPPSTSHGGDTQFIPQISLAGRIVLDGIQWGWVRLTHTVETEAISREALDPRTIHGHIGLHVALPYVFKRVRSTYSISDHRSQVLVSHFERKVCNRLGSFVSSLSQLVCEFSLGAILNKPWSQVSTIPHGSGAFRGKVRHADQV